MKGTRFLWIIIFILLFFNVSLLLTFNNKTSTVEEKILLQEQISNKYDYIIKQLLLHTHYDNTEIRDIPVKKIEYSSSSGIMGDDIEHKTLNLSEVLHGEKIVFHYTLGACNSCVSEQFVILDKLRKKIGNDRIVLLTTHLQKDVLLFLYANKINIDFYVVGSDDIGLSSDDGVSALLLLTSDQFVATSFVIDIDTKSYSSLFYDFIENKFVNLK
jgi:hypothetical protein